MLICLSSWILAGVDSTYSIANVNIEEGMFPVAERVGRLIVSLPMFTAMTEADVERSVAAVKAVLKAN